MGTPMGSSPDEGATGGGGTGGETQGAGGYAGDPALDAGSGGTGADAGADGGAGGAAGVPGGAQAGQGALFKFARREWPSQERAEREFLTTIGRLQAEQRRVQELEGLVEAYKGAKGAPGAPEGADQGEPGADGGADDGLMDIDSLDWQLISNATRERGPEVGMYLLAKALTEKLNEGITGRMQKSLEPFESFRGHATQSAQTARLWQQAQDATTPEGSLMFPELADPSVAPIVFDIWRQITEGLPPEVANSPRMARTAILEYRALTAGGGGLGEGADAGNGAGGGGVNPQSVAAGVVGAMRAGAQSAGVLPAGPGQTPVRQARQKPMTEEEQIRQSLVSEGQERSPLGFRR